MLLPALLLASALDADAALRHAAALAALGPHPWGSPRAPVAAEYVASQFRDVGLEEVRLQPFESHGIKGANVIGVLRAPGPDFVVLGAHHDTAPSAPGAYDDGGGVGILIEAARVLARRPERPRSLVFVSFDGEEAWSTGKTTTAGSRAYVDSLGREAANMTAAFIVEMSGFKGGTPVLHPIAYADPLKPGRNVVAPGWLVATALAGARGADAPLAVGDPWLAWLYQPAVRTFRIGFYGDDLAFLQAGLPAVFASDSSFSSFYPWYHRPADTADKLDAVALGRMGSSVLAVAAALERVPPRGGAERVWFSAFGRVIGSGWLYALGVLCVVPGLFLSLSQGGAPLAARGIQAALFGVLMWRHPVPALWVFLLPALAIPARRRWLTGLSLLPLLALLALGAVAARRGYVSGTWLSPWELAVAVGAFSLLWLPAPAAGGRSTRRPRGRASPRRSR
jgi:Peptidase family M28